MSIDEDFTLSEDIANSIFTNVQDEERPNVVSIEYDDFVELLEKVFELYDLDNRREKLIKRMRKFGSYKTSELEKAKSLEPSNQWLKEQHIDLELQSINDCPITIDGKHVPEEERDSFNNIYCSKCYAYLSTK